MSHRRTKAQRLARQIAVIPPETRQVIAFNAGMARLQRQMLAVMTPLMDRVMQGLMAIEPQMRRILDEQTKQREG